MGRYVFILYFYDGDTMFLLCVGASENVAKTNWRYAIWLLLRCLGLMKIIMSRLDVGHSHYDPDQRNSVFNRKIRGKRGGTGRRKGVHSLGKTQHTRMHI